MRTEVARLAVVAEGDGLVARVFAVRAGRPTEIESFPIVGFERARNVSNTRGYPHGWDLQRTATDPENPNVGEHDVIPDGGCGCGSPLKRFTPPGDLRMSGIVSWPLKEFA